MFVTGSQRRTGIRALINGKGIMDGVSSFRLRDGKVLLLGTRAQKKKHRCPKNILV
jgi:hypothetical protein